MICQYFKGTIRQMRRHKAFSIINIVGLVLGTTTCLFVAHFVLFEHSFERFNKNADRTFLVNLYNTNNGVFDQISAETASGLGYAIQQSVPGIESLSRVGSSNLTGIVSNKHQSKEYIENEIVKADGSVIDVLAIDLIEGDKKKILSSPQSVIISESIARKYFNDVRVLGKTLEIGFSDGNPAAKPYQMRGYFEIFRQTLISIFNSYFLQGVNKHGMRTGHGVT
jgi:putative ABC transport system permease protein